MDSLKLMKKKILLTFLLMGFTLMASAQFIQYGNGNNPPSNFTAHPDDLAGLQAIYDALDGPNWNVPNHVKWKTTPLNADGVTPFGYHRWYMVHFNANHRVSKLIFWPGDGLSGALPSEISLLSELEQLIIDGNNITDISAVRNVPSLKILSITNSNLTGQIPCIVEDLPSLITLDLKGNQLTGTLPNCLAGSGTSLEVLAVADNKLTGCIPESYDRFCSDFNRVYHFSNNLFENSIADVCNGLVCDDCPSQYPILWDFYQSTGGDNWTNITTNTVTVGNVNVPYMMQWWESTYHQFGFSNWQGIQSIIAFQPLFPDIDFAYMIDFYQNNPTLIDPGVSTTVTDAWFVDCDPCGLDDGSPWKGITCNGNGEITHINLHGSNLLGTLPSSLSGLTSLQSLNLGNNQLSGTIPSSYSDLIGLQIWNMENNQLSGVFPSYITTFDYLQYLNLGHNQLAGSLPSDFSNLSYLKEFRVNDNQLKGGISNTIGSCAQLIHLDASDNTLTGTLPASLGSLPDLTHIYLDENQFNGEVPGQWGDLQSIIRIDVSQNKLTGNQLNKNLEKLCPINTITNVHINDGNNIAELWSMMCHCVSTEYPTFSMYPAAITSLADPDKPCCQIFTDDVITDGDDNVYTAYRIGNQVWLQENLMTTSCLDGTPLPMYRSTGDDVSDPTYYGDNTCDTPIYANSAIVSNGNAVGDVVPYGRHYSQYIFSQNNAPYVTGNYTQYEDGAICQVCPEGYRIANAHDFWILNQFLGAKDIYDVSETCFSPAGGGYANSGAVDITTPWGNTISGVYPSNTNGSYIWVSDYPSTITPSSGSIIVLPYDVHVFPGSGITVGDQYKGKHLQARDHYRTLRCIKK